MDIFIFISLAAGFLLGAFPVLKEKGLRINSRLQSIWLILLLFSMGAGIGKDKEILRQLPLLGGKALLFAVFAIAGSVLCVYAAARFLMKEDRK